VVDSAQALRLIVAAWPDGRVIWSTDPVEGGPPYRSGRTDPAAIARLLDRLEKQGLFANGGLKWLNYGPDASFTAIAIDHAGAKVRMESWHERAESTGKLVATAGGLGALIGRSLSDVLAEQPPEYRRMRQVWSDIRQGLNAVIPAASQPAEVAVDELHLDD
jgi:hypothetical protein